MSTLLNGNLEPAEAADILWFLPTHGDGRYLGTQEGAREVSLRYLSQIARAADDLGYYGVQPITPDIVEAQQKIADTFHKLGLLPKPITVRDAVWTPSS